MQSSTSVLRWLCTTWSPHCCLPYAPQVPVTLLGIVAAAVVILLLWYHPEWYIINIAGVLISAGCAAIFRISLSIIPVLVLLILLMRYDAISVHRKKHMLTLADGVLRQKMPIMFIVPKSLGYSYRSVRFSLNDKKEQRGAYMIGIGDMIMPVILVVLAQESLRLQIFFCRRLVRSSAALQDCVF